MTEQKDFFPERKRVAEATVNLSALSKMGRSLDVIFDAITRQGDEGVTAGTLLQMFPSMPYSTVTTAPSKLLKMGLIYRRGDSSTGPNGRGHLVIRVERRFEQQLLLIPGRRFDDE